ncbi:hypothetical protein BC941DRAFT_502344 [Chlamydoabsidia padenii]|nr:hypothetical protein BC941DRAFT_502344 [Chlamydoabsidia padenii]
MFRLVFAGCAIEELLSGKGHVIVMQERSQTTCKSYNNHWNKHNTTGSKNTDQDDITDLPNNDFLHLCYTLVGSYIHATLKDGTWIKGYLHTTFMNNDRLEIVLKHACGIKNNELTIMGTLVIASGDLVNICTADFKFNNDQEQIGMERNLVYLNMTNSYWDPTLYGNDKNSVITASTSYQDNNNMEIPVYQPWACSYLYPIDYTSTHIYSNGTWFPLPGKGTNGTISSLASSGQQAIYDWISSPFNKSNDEIPKNIDPIWPYGSIPYRNLFHLFPGWPVNCYHPNNLM